MQRAIITACPGAAAFTRCPRSPSRQDVYLFHGLRTETAPCVSKEGMIGTHGDSVGNLNIWNSTQQSVRKQTDPKPERRGTCSQRCSATATAGSPSYLILIPLLYDENWTLVRHQCVIKEAMHVRHNQPAPCTSLSSLRMYQDLSFQNKNRKRATKAKGVRCNISKTKSVRWSNWSFYVNQG